MPWPRRHRAARGLRRCPICRSPAIAAFERLDGEDGTVTVQLRCGQCATWRDAELAAASYDLLAMFTILFGIPLSLTALASGVLLGLASKWGVVRHGWVAIKLVLLLGVILVGALVLGPGTDAMRNGDGGAETRLIAGSAYDVIALLGATGLSVFKPRRRRSRPAA